MHATLLAAVTLGGYINGFKLLPFALVSLVWLKLMTWADKDTDVARLPRDNVNLMNLGLWLVGLTVAIFVPNFWVALPAFLVFFAVDAIVYLSWRNSKVGLKDLKSEFELWWKNLGKKTEKKVTANENNVVLIDKSGKAMQPPPDESDARPGFDALQSVLQTPIRSGASRVDLKPTEGGAVVRYTVDGVTMEGKTVPKDQAAGAIGLVKQLAGLDSEDRRRPQKGKMKIGTETAKHDIDIETAGTKAGEQMRLSVDFKKGFDFRVADLGLLPDQEKTVLDLIKEPGGVVLLTAPDGQGQTNLAYAILKQHDAFLSHIQTIERDPPVDLEGITQNRLAATAPQGEEAKQMSWLISQEPDVFFLDRVDDPRTAADIARNAMEGKRGYVAMRVSSTADALAQWRKVVGDDTLAMNSLKLIVAERLVRVLCDACKIAYTPDGETLKRMNMSPDKVDKLFRPRKEPMLDQKGNPVICPFCHGMAYKGRTGVFELFRIDDDVRQTVINGGTSNQFKALFRRQKQKYLQEAALAKVEAGVTSVDEVLRVLRGPSTGSSRSSAQPSAALD